MEFNVKNGHGEEKMAKIWCDIKKNDNNTDWQDERESSASIDAKCSGDHIPCDKQYKQDKPTTKTMT